MYEWTIFVIMSNLTSLGKTAKRNSMSNRDAQIIQAATQVFARYGYGKTTMNDIAEAAGVARQTLYNAYTNKEEILRGCVRVWIEQNTAEVAQAWKDLSTFEEKLDVYFEKGPLKWFDDVQQSPDVAEIIDGLHRIAGEEMAEASRIWTGMFTDALNAHFGKDPSHAETAEFIYSTSKNAKYGIANRSVLEGRLKILKASVMALLKEA